MSFRQQKVLSQAERNVVCMTRIVELDAKAPKCIKKEDIKGDAVWICMCGLSKKFPFCDSSHKDETVKSEQDDKLYVYDRDESGKLVQIEVLDEDEEDCEGTCDIDSESCCGEDDDESGNSDACCKRT